MGAAGGGGATPASLSHAHGERRLVTGHCPLALGRERRRACRFTFTQTATHRVQGCEAGRGGERFPARFQKPHLHAHGQRVSEDPFSTKRNTCAVADEERVPVLEATGRGPEGRAGVGHHQGPQAWLHPVTGPSSFLWEGLRHPPILCCGLARRSHSQVLMTESWWQGHLHLPVTLAEMSTGWPRRGKSRTEETSPAPREKRLRWGGERQRRVPTTCSRVQAFVTLIVRAPVLFPTNSFPNTLEQGFGARGLTNSSLRQLMAGYTAGVS